MKTIQGGRWAVLGAVGLLLGGAYGAPAWAGQKGTAVAVSLDPQVAAQTSTISYVLQSVVRQSPRLDYVDLAERAQGSAAAARARKAQDAARAYKSAKQAYDQLDLDNALTGFEDAVRLYQQADLSQHMQGLLDSEAMLAATRYFNGDVKGAREALERLLSLKPNFHFDPSTFSPPLQKMGESVRTDVQNSRDNPLEVQTRPVPGRVYVDGRFVGMSPQELKDLAPGRHYVTVLAPGYAFVQQTERAAPGQLAKYRLKPADDGRALLSRLATLKKGFKSGDVSAAGASLARWAHCDEILVAGVSQVGPGQVKVVAARVASDGHVLAVGDHALSTNDPRAMSSLATFAMGLYRKDLPRGPGGAPVVTRVEAPSGPPSPVWGYVTGGTGLAAVAVGTVFAFEARGTAAKAKKIPQVQQDQIHTLTSQARTQALLADTFIGVGVAAVGVGIWLALPPKGAGGEPGGSSGDDDFFSLAPAPLPGGAGVWVVGRF